MQRCGVREGRTAGGAAAAAAEAFGRQCRRVERFEEARAPTAAPRGRTTVSNEEAGHARAPCSEVGASLAPLR